MAVYRKMWESLGLDLESHDQLMNFGRYCK